MTNLTPAAGRPAADLFPLAGTVGRLGSRHDQRTLEHERLEHRARGTDATAQLLRCFPRWTRALEQLTARALERLARNEPVNPNDPDDDAGLDWSIVTTPASLLDERLRARTGGSTIRPCGRISSTSAACSPRGSGSTSAMRTTCRGGCSPTPASSTRPTCAAGGSARTPGSRSPASGSTRSARSSGRSACSSCRRSDRATGGS